MLLENQGDECSDTELSFEYTQPIRSQQFYADMDTKLDGLNRDDYIKELVRICRKDVSMVTDYRDRLAERTLAFRDCPQTRLVNRRNSSTGTREEKCAINYYILYAYNNDVRNREILEVFTAVPTTANDTIVSADEEERQFISPELFGLITNLQSDILDIKKLWLSSAC